MQNVQEAGEGFFKWKLTDDPDRICGFVTKFIQRVVGTGRLECWTTECSELGPLRKRRFGAPSALDFVPVNCHPVCFVFTTTIISYARAKNGFC